MKLLDSNILIYAPQPEYASLLPLLIDPECVISEITKLEVLGYHKLTEIEKHYYEKVFSQIIALPITSEIVNKAISLKQYKKMSIGDAIIAATAILNDLELQTRNIDDFKHIVGLMVNDPFENHQ